MKPLILDASQGRRLEGWKHIAQALGVTPRTAYRYSRMSESPLKVKYLEGRVYSYEAWTDAFINAHAITAAEYDAQRESRRQAS